MPVQRLDGLTKDHLYTKIIQILDGLTEDHVYKKIVCKTKLIKLMIC